MKQNDICKEFKESNSQNRSLEKVRTLGEEQLNSVQKEITSPVFFPLDKDDINITLDKVKSALNGLKKDIENKAQLHPAEEMFIKDLIDKWFKISD